MEQDAAPCGPALTWSLFPGGPGTPPCRHYDRCARSSLVVPGLSRRRKRGPGLAAAFGPRQNAAVERREASALR